MYDLDEDFLPPVFDERKELAALASFNDVLGGPSFIMRRHWREGYQSLVRRGLVTWGDPPDGFAKSRFAGIQITEKGRAFISTTQGAETGNG